MLLERIAAAEGCDVKILWRIARLSCADRTESPCTLSAGSRGRALTILSVYGEFSI